MFLFKIIIEELLGGTMEKMLKNNNGLTAFNTFLLAILVVLMYQEHKAAVTMQDQVTDIRHALYYKLNIRTDAPDKRGQDEQGKNDMFSDIMLAETKQEITRK